MLFCPKCYRILTDGDAKHGHIAVDDNGKIHVNYYDHTNKNLKYATNASGVWVTETLDNIRRTCPNCGTVEAEYFNPAAAILVFIGILGMVILAILVLIN